MNIFDFSKYFYLNNLIAKPDNHEAKKLVCTDTINCPFFSSGNIKLNSLVKKENLDDLNDSNQQMDDMEKAKVRG